MVAVGTGKTYSTSRVIDWIETGLETNANDEAFAYFYCNKQEASRFEPREILRNIIRQLATGPLKDHVNRTTVHKKVHELWSKDMKRGILSTFAAWEACLLELVDTYPRTTIVLDALDECTIGKREALINLLVKLASRGSHARPVKIFVAARPADDIRRHLGENPVILMQDKHNAGDIESFIRARISEHPRWFRMPQHFQREVVDALLEKSGDMFLFASLQIQRLLTCDTKLTMRKRLATLPDTLKTTYEDIIRSATSDPDEGELLNRALRWVMCSARPLTTRELLFAVSQDPEVDVIKPQIDDLDEDLMLKWTRNLLHLDSEARANWDIYDENDTEPMESDEVRVWRLAHQAVAEFLEDSSCCNPGFAHREAGKVCLMTLLDTLSATAPEARSDTNYPLTEYAICGWPTHIRAQEDGVALNIDGLSRTLQMFMGEPNEGSPAFNRWLIHIITSGRELRGLEWSIFGTRPMPALQGLNPRMMAPMTLACHLGIYACLLDWWDAPNLDHNLVYEPLSMWSPNLKWGVVRLSSLSGLRWSLIALACVHNETKIIKHLLGRDVRVNNAEYNVPPLVAAAVADSVEAVVDLMDNGADTCWPSTIWREHVLWYATNSNSLRVMRLLLQKPRFSRATELEEILKSFDCVVFRSADAMSMLIDMGINVNTPLSSKGTLLLAAAINGWEKMVGRLLENGAQLNPQTNLGTNGMGTSLRLLSLLPRPLHRPSHYLLIAEQAKIART